MKMKLDALQFEDIVNSKDEHEDSMRCIEANSV